MGCRRRSLGHLLLVATATKIVALDPWAARDRRAAACRCNRGLERRAGSELAPRRSSGPRTSSSHSARSWYKHDRCRPRHASRTHANPFGPVNGRYVSFLRNTGIAVADPLTGDLLWTRQDIPPRSKVFGDEQYLLVLAPGSEEASVYRATDGQLLGTRKVPRPQISSTVDDDGSRQGRSFALSNSALSNSGIDFFGRCVLTWQPGSLSASGDDVPAHGVLAFFDPWQQKAVWPSRTFAPGACVSMAGSEAIGVLEPSGHFVLIALGDGRTIADLQLPVRPQFDVTDLLVTHMGDQYIVLASDSHVPVKVIDEPPQSPYGLFLYPMRRARVYALDLNGKFAWQAPVDVDHEQFLINQPARLPVLLFADFHFELIGIQTLRVALVAVDRRNGNIVYDKKSASPMPGSLGAEIRGVPQAATVRILAGNDTVNLHFTDKPVQTTVRQSSGVEKADGKSRRFRGFNGGRKTLIAIVLP